jgi:hypothetical protein
MRSRLRLQATVTLSAVKSNKDVDTKLNEDETIVLFPRAARSIWGLAKCGVPDC